MRRSLFLPPSLYDVQSSYVCDLEANHPSLASGENRISRHHHAQSRCQLRLRSTMRSIWHHGSRLHCQFIRNFNLSRQFRGSTFTKITAFLSATIRGFILERMRCICWCIVIGDSVACVRGGLRGGTECDCALIPCESGELVRI